MSMNASEFARKYNFKSSDKRVAEKVYGNEERTEQEWFDSMKKEFDFQDTDVLRKVREAKNKKSEEQPEKVADKSPAKTKTNKK